MIYVDDIFYWPGHIAPKARKYGRRWCHLWCDPGEEELLHKLAASIGVGKKWYQKHRILDHYDLVASKRKTAITVGAKPTNMIKWMLERIPK